MTTTNSLGFALQGEWGRALHCVDHARKSDEAGPNKGSNAHLDATSALIYALIGDTASAQSRLAHCYKSEVTPTANRNQRAAVFAEFAKILLRADQGIPVTTATQHEMLDSVCTDPTFWPFALHVRAQELMVQGETDEVLHLLEDVSVSRSTEVRSSEVLGGLLFRDYCDALLLAGEGNRLQQCAEEYPRQAVAILPLTHLSLRVGQPLKSLRYSLFVVNNRHATRRDRYEARLLQAAAELQLGRKEQARLHYQSCERVILRDFPALTHKLAARTYGALTTLEESTAFYSHCSLRIDNRFLRMKQKPPTVKQNYSDEHFRFVRLTDREREILLQLSGGASAQMIAESSVVSVHTVLTQLKTIYRKLLVNCAQEAVIEAERLGLIDMVVSR